MSLIGFLFLFIMVLNPAMGAFGHLMEKDDYDSDAELQKINNHPNKFKISIVLALIEHGSVIALAIMLFIAFGSYSLIFGIVWITFRIEEGLFQFIYEKNYWGLLNIARQYPGASGAEKNSLIDLGRSILKTKSSSFSFAQILFSIGTLSYSILFITYGVVPAVFGWLGIVASILYGFGNGIKLVKPNFKILGFGGLLAILFEVIIGGWLLFFSHTIP
jgi:hypothetical protein